MTRKLDEVGHRYWPWRIDCNKFVSQMQKSLPVFYDNMVNLNLSEGIEKWPEDWFEMFKAWMEFNEDENCESKT